MSYRIVGKYIKDLEFSIPNSKAFYLLTENIANYKINIDIKSNKIALEKIILIDVPDKIYPELREVFVKLFEYSGFKDIKINEKIDFNKLYKIRKAQ